MPSSFSEELESSTEVIPLQKKILDVGPTLEFAIDLTLVETQSWAETYGELIRPPQYFEK